MVKLRSKNQRCDEEDKRENNLTYTYKTKEEYLSSEERYTDDGEEYDSSIYLNRVLITAYLDGKKVGTSLLEYLTYTDEEGDSYIDEDKDEAYLERIDVLDEYQGKGIGTQLLKHTIEKASNLGLSSSIVLAPDNERAKRWYERIGSEIYDNDWLSVDQGFGVYRIRPYDLE